MVVRNSFPLLPSLTVGENLQLEPSGHLGEDLIADLTQIEDNMTMCSEQRDLLAYSRLARLTVIVHTLELFLQYRSLTQKAGISGLYRVCNKGMQNLL